MVEKVGRRIIQIAIQIDRYIHRAWLAHFAASYPTSFHNFNLKFKSTFITFENVGVRLSQMSRAQETAGGGGKRVPIEGE